MLKGSTPNKFDNWVCILERGTEHEVNLVKNYLDSLDIPSNILSKRDSSINLNFGELSMVYLYVPKKFEKEARKALKDIDESLNRENNDTDETEGTTD